MFGAARSLLARRLTTSRARRRLRQVAQQLCVCRVPVPEGARAHRRLLRGLPRSAIHAWRHCHPRHGWYAAVGLVLLDYLSWNATHICLVSRIAFSRSPALSIVCLSLYRNPRRISVLSKRASIFYCTSSVLSCLVCLVLSCLVCLPLLLACRTRILSHSRLLCRYKAHEIGCYTLSYDPI